MLHIVDDEEVIRDALAWLAQSRMIAAVTYASGSAFLTPTIVLVSWNSLVGTNKEQIGGFVESLRVA